MPVEVFTAVSPIKVSSEESSEEEEGAGVGAIAKVAEEMGKGAAVLKLLGPLLEAATSAPDWGMELACIDSREGAIQGRRIQGRILIGLEDICGDKSVKLLLTNVWWIGF
jgi:hypothetical protein